MHIIDSFGKKTLWHFQNCKDIICECHRTDATGETKMKLQTGNEQHFWGAVFHCLLIWLWMRPERAYTFCRFPKVSAALWRVCRHIIGRLAIRDYICQGSARCPLSKLLRNLQLHAFCHAIQRGKDTSTNHISSKRYVKNTLRIGSKQRLPCFSRYYGVNLEKSLAFG